jgi:hypothetical protein
MSMVDLLQNLRKISCSISSLDAKFYFITKLSGGFCDFNSNYILIGVSNSDCLGPLGSARILRVDPSYLLHQYSNPEVKVPEFLGNICFILINAERIRNTVLTSQKSKTQHSSLDNVSVFGLHQFGEI